MMRRVIIFAVVVLGIVAGLPAGAESALDVLKKVDAQFYYPQDHGLKDLGAKLVNEGEETFLGGVGVALYWKAPNRTACRIDLPAPMKQDAQMAKIMKEKMQEVAVNMIRFAVPLKLADEATPYTWTASADGDLTQVAGTRKPGGAKDPSQPDQMTYWVDAKGLPVKMSTTANGRTETMTSLKYDEKDGKKLLVSFTIQGEQNKPSSFSMKHSQVESIWICTSFEITDPAGRPMKAAFKDLAVNKGVDEKVFKGE